MATSGSAANPNSVLSQGKGNAQGQSGDKSKSGTQPPRLAELNPAQFQSQAGVNVAAGQNILTSLNQQYKDNKTITDLTIGGLADTGIFQTKLGLFGLYNNSLMAAQAGFQQALNAQNKADTADLMSKEAVLTGGLAKQQIQGAVDLQAKTNQGTKDVATLQKGASDYAALQTRGASDFRSTADLLGVKAQATASENVAAKQATAAENVAGKQATAAENVAAKQATAAENVASKQQAAAENVAAKQAASAENVASTQATGALNVQKEQNLATKYGIDSQEAQIGLKGAEDRRTLQEGTRQQLALRRDARGAIARSGARFYG